jgi:serine/threonine protein kinase
MCPRRRPSLGRMASDTLRLSAIVEIGARSRGPSGPDLVGRRLGPYLLVERIGAGAYAAVYRAWHEIMEVDRAVKVLHRPLQHPGADWLEQRARLSHEARVAASMRHANVVAVHDCGIEPDGTAYLVMEYVAGRSLAARLREGVPPPEETVRVAAQVAAALDHAHAMGVIHRDVKPANILLTRDGTARLGDFGIAHTCCVRDDVSSGAALGTPAYMSPEQCGGNLAAMDLRSDVYSFAAVLYEMLTGCPPLGRGRGAVERHRDGETPPPPSAVNPNLGPRVDRVLARGLARDRLDRCPSAGLLSDQLAAALARGAARVSLR